MKKVFLLRMLMALMALSLWSCNGDDDNDVTPPDNEQKSNEPEESKIELSSSGRVNGFECVDLGLSVKWATCNIGASFPENCGGYYALGEITTKSTYTLENYLLYKDGKYLNYGNDISQTTHDVAYLLWGKKWRMPTYQEFVELENKCSFQWVTYNDVEGCLVTGQNGNKMFIPAGGVIQGQNNFSNSVLLWGSTLWPYGEHYDLTQCDNGVAFSVWKAQNVKPNFEIRDRYIGIPIRAVTTAVPTSSDDGSSDDNDGGSSGSQTNEPPYVISFDFSATKTSITVKFMCNERPSSATVKYGTSSPSSTISSSISGKQVTATASGLKAGTKYYFKCTVKNSYGSSTSDTFSAITNY